MQIFGIVLTGLTLANTLLMMMTWVLRVPDATYGIAFVCLVLHAGLLAEAVARSCNPSYCPRRSHPLFLVLDTLLTAAVALHTMQVCGWAVFQSAWLAHAMLAVWPIAIANWVSRLALETDLFWVGSQACMGS